LAKFLLFLRQPDAYKGKGIRYANDRVFQKSRAKDSKKRLSFIMFISLDKNHHQPLSTLFLKPSPNKLNSSGSPRVSDPFFVGERLFFHGLPLEADMSIVRCLGRIHGLGRHRLSLIASFLGTSPHFLLSLLSRKKWLSLEPFSRFFVLDRGLKKFVKSRTTFFVKSGHYRGLRQQQGLPSRGQRTRTNAKTSKNRQRPQVLSDKEQKALKKQQKLLKKKAKKLPW
jgi:small subunit ribosomal protein S13